MGLPNQNIPESKKDKTWMKRCGAAIVNMGFISRGAKMKDKFCYDMYNGVQDEGSFDYLRKVGDYEYPAKVRFVPLLRPKLDLLRAEETKRPFNWRVYTVDSTSINDKNEARFKAIINQMSASKMQMGQQYQLALEQMDMIKQQIAQIQAEAQETGQQIPPEMQMKLKMAEKEADLGKYVINNQNLINDKDLEDIEVYFKYKYQDFLEKIAERGLKYMIANYSLKDEFNMGFEDKLCTDKEYYFVDYEEGQQLKDPWVRKVNPLGFYYAADSQVKWVEDSSWCMEERFMTINQIIDEYGNKLSFEDMEKIKKRSEFIDTQSTYGYGYNGGMGGNGTNTGMGIGDVNGCLDGLYAGTEEYANVVRVCRCYWQSPRKLRFKNSPNKYQEGSSYTHMLSEDEQIREDKGETEDSGYINDIYQCTVIDTGIYVDFKKKNIIRSEENPAEAKLPYVGKAHNHYTKKPYSLVWAAKDVQILYNIVHYHKELALALSGAKGFIMDKSQVPEGMSIKEWMYQRKLGVGWIESVRSGMNRQPTFNQFQNFDDSLGPGIQALFVMLQHLEELASSITGVSRQRMGTVAPTDQVGTNEQAVSQSALVTEIIFHEHEEVKRQVFQRLINLTRKAWKKGKHGSYVLGDLDQGILDVPPKVMERADYKVFATDSGKEEKAMRELKMMAAQEHAKGLLTFGNLVKLYNVDSLSELEASISKYEELAMKKMDANKQAEHANQKELKDLDNQVKIMLDKQADEAKMFMAQLEQAKLEFEKQKFQVEESRLSSKDDGDLEVENKKADDDFTMEQAYLDQQKKEALQDYEVNKAELALKGVEATENLIEENRKQKQKLRD